MLKTLEFTFSSGKKLQFLALQLFNTFVIAKLSLELAQQGIRCPVHR